VSSKLLISCVDVPEPGYYDAEVAYVNGLYGDLEGRLEKLLYRVEEACTVTGLGRTKLYDEIARKRIGVVHFGKSVRIPADELRAYVDRAKAEAGLAPVA
jgi:excisionase family DNA binding protein